MFYVLAILHLIGSGYTYYRLYRLNSKMKRLGRLIQQLDDSLVQVLSFCNDQDKQILNKVVELSRDQTDMYGELRWLQIMNGINPEKIPNV